MRGTTFILQNAFRAPTQQQYLASHRYHHHQLRTFTSNSSSAQKLQPSMTIHRTTLFKIPEEAQREKLLEFYRGMSTKALKVYIYLFSPHPFPGPYPESRYQSLTNLKQQDGKPYIISVKAGPTFDDQRRQGFTFAAQSVFASEEDMKYYDNGCAAHAELKEYAKTVHQGIMMVYFEDKLA